MSGEKNEDCSAVVRKMALTEIGSSTPSQTILTMLQCVSQGPIAQWLEQSAHKSAIALTNSLSGNKNQMALKQKCLKRNLTWRGNSKGTVAWL